MTHLTIPKFLLAFALIMLGNSYHGSGSDDFCDDFSVNDFFLAFGIGLICSESYAFLLIEILMNPRKTRNSVSESDRTRTKKNIPIYLSFQLAVFIFFVIGIMAMIFGMKYHGLMLITFWLSVNLNYLVSIVEFYYVYYGC